MKRSEPLYGQIVRVLQAELVPAMGCTEPIALSYGAAKLRQALGTLPAQVEAEISGNIIKNVKSVIVPNTGGRKGIQAAIAAGIVAGDAERALEVLSGVTEEQLPGIGAYMALDCIRVRPADNDKTFYIALTGRAGGDSARVVIEDAHTNITLLEKNGLPVIACADSQGDAPPEPEEPELTVQQAYDFADGCDLRDVEPMVGPMITLNSAISEEGLARPYGAQIGRILLKGNEGSVEARARAAAAAGSDARMSGCDMPVIIVSGSGNQGMTASLPVVEYARFYGVPRERLLRAVTLSCLVTIHQKASIGRLSAFCGAVSAGCGAAAGIAYLLGGDYTTVAHTIVNTLAIASGMVCDGAKPSCAAKIATAVDAGLLGYKMYLGGQEFRDGEGIVVKGVDNTIRNVGRMAHDGMRQTDREILDIMTGRK